MRLEQKQGFKRRTFEVVEDKLKQTYKSLSEYKEWTVGLETIGTEIFIERKSRKGSIALGGFFLVFALFFLAVNAAAKDSTIDPWNWIAIGGFYLLFSSIVLLTPLKNELRISGGYSQVTFFLDSPSQKEVESFANKIIDKAKQITLDRYSRIDPDIPEETMMNQLNWLRSIGFITEMEYESKKEEYRISKLIN